MWNQTKEAKEYFQHLSVHILWCLSCILFVRRREICEMGKCFNLWTKYKFMKFTSGATWTLNGKCEKRRETFYGFKRLFSKKDFFSNVEKLMLTSLKKNFLVTKLRMRFICWWKFSSSFSLFVSFWVWRESHLKLNYSPYKKEFLLKLVAFAKFLEWQVWTLFPFSKLNLSSRETQLRKPENCFVSFHCLCKMS
jgi:hypothetical protein